MTILTPSVCQVYWHWWHAEKPVHKYKHASFFSAKSIADVWMEKYKNWKYVLSISL